MPFRKLGITKRAIHKSRDSKKGYTTHKKLPNPLKKGQKNPTSSYAKRKAAVKVSHKKTCHFKKTREGGDAEMGEEGAEGAAAAATATAATAAPAAPSADDFLSFQKEHGLLDDEGEIEGEEGGENSGSGSDSDSDN
jgi:hypothetical protein